MGLTHMERRSAAILVGNDLESNHLGKQDAMEGVWIWISIVSS
jgi:hypothetical protein